MPGYVYGATAGKELRRRSMLNTDEEARIGRIPLPKTPAMRTQATRELEAELESAPGSDLGRSSRARRLDSHISRCSGCGVWIWRGTCRTCPEIHAAELNTAA